MSSAHPDFADVADDQLTDDDLLKLLHASSTIKIVRPKR